MAKGRNSCPMERLVVKYTMTFSIEIEREEDGRWLAEVPALAGVMCYGASRDEAVARVQALALRVIAERLACGSGVVARLV
jgi:predicted RNase H-like HicB family nuclease